MKGYGNALVWGLVLAGLVALAWWVYKRHAAAISKATTSLGALPLPSASTIADLTQLEPS